MAEAEFALNNTVNRSTEDTPARLLFGTNQVGRTNDELRVILQRQNQKDRDLEEIRANAVTQMKVGDIYNKQYYDKKHKVPTKYKLGDYVMIKNVDVTPGVNKKLLPKYRGPYVVKRVLDNNQYTVCNPKSEQLTKLPFEGVCAPENMKHWVREECN